MVDSRSPGTSGRASACHFTRILRVAIKPTQWAFGNADYVLLGRQSVDSAVEYASSHWERLKSLHDSSIA